MTADDDPQTYQDVMQSVDKDCWIRAIEEELSSHDINGTFSEPLLLPEGKTAVNTRFIFIFY